MTFFQNYLQREIDAVSAGGVTLSSYSDYFSSDIFTNNIPSDGATHNLKVILADPPEWLDGSGNIIFPGLYTSGLIILGNASIPTTPGLYLKVLGPFNASWLQSIDAIRALSGVTMSDTQSLGESDLPYPTTSSIVSQIDATATYNAKAFAVRLAY